MMALKNWMLAGFGVGYILLMVGWSVLFHLQGAEIPKTVMTNGEEGLAAAPFSPSSQIPFGTDRNGYHMFYKVLDGAVYTLGAAISISLVAFLLAFLVGVLMGFWKPAVRRYSDKVLMSFYFIPQSIIAYNVLYPLLWETPDGFTTTLNERIIWTILVLAFIMLPTTAILISNETKEILGKEFIAGARVLGGSRFFLFWKHVLPHLKGRLFILFPKLVIQALLIIAHLGFFTIYFGGTEVCYDLAGCDPPKPFVQEWASVMGTNYSEIYNAWWIFMTPMLFFSLAIMALTAITKGLEGLLDPSVKPRKKKVISSHHHASSAMTAESFQRVGKEVSS
ncbi:ABC transporter permease subunit [Rossellomorea marisflavi]|uniref:ABC transporter permease n=1 Tax=Rossellomorea marisflavi TaxID=189381 RepID=UPI0034597DD6